MSTPLRVLILEDRPSDADLMAYELRRSGYEPAWQRVDTEAGYLAQLAPEPDLILADYSLPQFDGLRALQLLQERGLDVPFIIVSGSIGEELAVQAMKWGAADYLLKDRLARLGQAVARALEEKRLRDEKRGAEEELRQRNVELSRLYRASGALISSVTPDLQNLAQTIVETVLQEFGQSNCSLLLVERGSQELNRIAVAGSYADQVSKGKLMLDGSGLVPRAIRTGEIINTPNVLSDPNYVPNWEAARSELTIPLKMGEHVAGAIDVQSAEPAAFNADDERLMSIFAKRAALALENARLYEDLQRSNVDLSLAYDTTLEGWARALELRDVDTEGHTRRVTELTLRLGRALGMNGEELVHIRRGALLHDIGKMGIPDSILLKPGPLTSEEWEIMHKHPIYAYELLKPITFLGPVLDIPYCHHEKWDGTGYPRGLKGEDIPLAARVFAVVDVWDALRSDRPYRAARPEEKVREYIRKQTGKHFDPQVVDAFLDLLRSKQR